MAKVIVERPRYGSRASTKGKGYDRRTSRLAPEDQPKREGMKLRGGGSKSLNEHLGPLRRYLARQVGQPWNKVFADVCRYLDRNSAVQDHVRDHLQDYVATCVFVHGGRLCHGDGHAIGRPLYTLFYVCPRTGVLRKTPGRDSKRRWHYNDRAKLPTRLLGHGLALVRKDGGWHIVTAHKFPDRVGVRGVGHAPAVHIQRWDALLKANLYRDQALRIYGYPIHVTTTRRPSKRELRGLINSYPHTNLVR